jgi:hypothetical protein
LALQEKWKLSADRHFVTKARDIDGLYLNPPERAVVLAVDEKSQLQALDNSSTHKTPPGEALAFKRIRIKLHLTRTSSSWLTLVGRWFAELTNKQLRR